MISCAAGGMTAVGVGCSDLLGAGGIPSAVRVRPGFNV
jgi:hypothetical protein